MRINLNPSQVKIWWTKQAYKCCRLWKTPKAMYSHHHEFLKGWGNQTVKHCDPVLTQTDPAIKDAPYCWGHLLQRDVCPISTHMLHSRGINTRVWECDFIMVLATARVKMENIWKISRLFRCRIFKRLHQGGLRLGCHGSGSPWAKFAQSLIDRGILYII